MEELIIEHRVKKQDEGRYYRIEFETPPDVESVTVAYSYPRVAKGGSSPVNIIDLGLEDADGVFLGWSGSSRREVSAGETFATRGYRRLPAKAGRWHILVGAYRVQPDGVPVRYSISFRKKKPRWLFGDLHMHSDASDGRYDIPTLAKKAVRMGLDFISVTNHNNYAENFCLPTVPGLTIIPGSEWTHYKGHMNFFGIKQPFVNSFIANSEEEMQRLVAQAKDAGALISVNHPKCGLCPYLWKDESLFDCVEIWNGPMRGVNIRGIAYWDSLQKSGRRIPAVGGSDFHRGGQPVRMGNPVTAVLSRSSSADDILDAVRAGRSYVTSGVGGARLSLFCAGAGFGDTCAESGAEAEFSADRAPAFSSLRLIGKNGEIASAAAKNGKACGRAKITDTPYAYLLLTQRLPGLGDFPRAVSNPVYFE